MFFLLSFCGRQDWETHQKARLQHFLSDLAILGSLQVGEQSCYTMHSFKQSCTKRLRYLSVACASFLSAGFLLLSAPAEGERGIGADYCQ